MWSLWNPVSLKIVRLPPLILKDGDGECIDECCLTAPPDDPTSVLLLTRNDASTFVFCQLNCKRKRMRWTEMSYAKQLKRITYDGELLHSLNCCNGKIYALNSDGFICPIVIHVEIVVKGGREVLIQLLMFGACPWSDSSLRYNRDSFFKGYVGTIGMPQEVGREWYDSGRCRNLTRVLWEEINDLKDAVFYADLGRDRSIFYNPAVASELGGYIHFRDELDGILYSYHVKDRTIIEYPMLPRVVATTYVLMWEGRLEDDHVEARCTYIVKPEKDGQVVTYEVFKHNESCLHNIPFDVLKMIMGHCVGVEYLNFRAACKLCRLAAPPIRWRDESSSRRLRNYSLSSPWLMVVDKYRGIMTFTDPFSGDTYFVEDSKLSIVDNQMYCSRYGWLLFGSGEFDCPVFLNPFTSDLHKLPEFGCIKSLCFSAPPNSSDCMVAGFSFNEGQRYFIYSVGALDPSWRFLHLGDDDYIYSLTFIGRDLYALGKEGQVIVFKTLGEGEIRKFVLTKAPVSSCNSMATQYFMMSCGEHLLIVIVGEFGEVELFKRNDCADKWEKIDGIGKHTIYIGGTTSVCVDAKTPEMENKIYFPQLVRYSPETRMYHAFDGKIVKKCFRGFLGAKTHFNYHAWIEPSWC
ncbi:uncharacterized protein [Rutidosis leptorrhynchoides]|uniref:uncharacterized protein n=1 Tax=Rutidosis leptorrhynchoides TaxID=125765 RepID=UPI003A9A09A5